MESVFWLVLGDQFCSKFFKNSKYTSFDGEFDADYENRIFRIFWKLGEFILNLKVLKPQYLLEYEVQKFWKFVH